MFNILGGTFLFAATPLYDKTINRQEQKLINLRFLRTHVRNLVGRMSHYSTNSAL